MGGEISIDDFAKIPPEVFDRSPRERQFKPPMDAMLEDLDRSNAAEAVKSLAEIALETINPTLAETCRNAIGLILTEYGASTKRPE